MFAIFIFMDTGCDAGTASYANSAGNATQGYITADGLKTFLEMGKLYEDAGGDDIYHSKLLPEITALEIKYSKDDIIDKI